MATIKEDEFMVEKQFTIYTPDKKGCIIVGEGYDEGSWFWNYFCFDGFVIDDIVFQGSAIKYEDGWNIRGGFEIIKNEQKISFNPTESDLERFCELAVNDFSTLKKELYKLANVEGNIVEQDLKVEFVTFFKKDNVEVYIGEVGKKSKEGITICYRTLDFCNIPIGENSEWTIYGYLAQKSGEQAWNIRKVYLSRDVFLSDSVVEEEILLAKRTFEPLKKNFESLFEVMKNEKFELVEEILEKAKNLPFPKIPKRAKSDLAYYTRFLKFRVFVRGNRWTIGIEGLLKKGYDKKVAATLRRLIRLTMKTNDDTKLRRFCDKIINQESSKTNC